MGVFPEGRRPDSSRVKVTRSGPTRRVPSAWMVSEVMAVAEYGWEVRGGVGSGVLHATVDNGQFCAGGRMRLLDSVSRSEYDAG